jgi:endo-1,4-beta-xylanase
MKFLKHVAMNRIMVFCLFLILGLNICSCKRTEKSAASNEGLAMLAQNVRPDFYLGSFTSGLNPSDSSFERISGIFKTNFNIATIGVYMKRTQREQGKYDFNAIDGLVDFASANNIIVYFHPLIGGQEYSPEWINTGVFTKEELERIMRERITTILTRYGSKIQYVDVVNEALDGKMKSETEFSWITSVRDKDHIWMKYMGMYEGKRYSFPQYFVDAFRIAREVGDKNLKLIVNENFNATTTSPDGIATLQLVKAMREEGIPVDGAGIQLHCNISDGVFYEWKDIPFEMESFDSLLKMYEEAGIDVHITEFDIHLPQNPSEADFQLQGKYYAEILKHAMQSPAVKTFKTWGFSDKASWKPDGIDGHPLMLDENCNPKPAYIQQLEMLKTMAKAPPVSQ